MSTTGALATTSARSAATTVARAAAAERLSTVAGPRRRARELPPERSRGPRRT